MKITLTDTEWLQLLDGEAADSELPKCCADVSNIRDVLSQVVRDGRNEEVCPYLINELEQAISRFKAGHKPTKLLKKVAEQIQKVDDFDAP